jgi:hypothetical protein
MSRRIQNLFRSVLAPLVLAALAGPANAASVCGDVNANGAISSSDALAVLRKSVGLPLFLECSDYVDRYGFPADTHKSSLNSADFLLGMPVTIEHPATVTHLGMISRQEGTHVRMALYKDSGGSPGALVVGTSSTVVLLGSQEIAVTPTAVAAGGYWIMAIFDADTLVASDEEAPPGNLIKYRALTYANALPDPFGATLMYDQTQLNYWVKVQQ